MCIETSWPMGVLIAKLHDCPADDGLPESLAAVILQCLQSRPEHQPTANEMAHVSRVHSAGGAKAPVAPELSYFAAGNGEAGLILSIFMQPY